MPAKQRMRKIAERLFIVATIAFVLIIYTSVFVGRDDYPYTIFLYLEVLVFVVFAGFGTLLLLASFFVRN